MDASLARARSSASCSPCRSWCSCGSGASTARCAGRLAVIFLLGAAQGALGWWMVQSGLDGGARRGQPVPASRASGSRHRPVRLHPVDGAGSDRRAQDQRRGAARSSAAGASCLRGSCSFKSCSARSWRDSMRGTAFSTGRRTAGAWIPSGLYDLSPWWINHFENHALVHFQHRTVGYCRRRIGGVALCLSFEASVADKPLARGHPCRLALPASRSLLGVFTVVSGVASAAGALHQIVALALFACALSWTYALGGPLRRHRLIEIGDQILRDPRCRWRGARPPDRRRP